MERVYNNDNKKRNCIFIEMIAILGMLVFNLALSWSAESSKLRMLMVAFITVFVLVVPLLITAKVGAVNEWVSRVIDEILKKIDYIKNNKRKVIIYALIYVIAIPLANFIEFICSNIEGAAMNPNRTIIIYAVLVLIVSGFALRKIAGDKPQVVFAIFTLVIGMACIRVVPSTLGISLDDESHYFRTIALANIFDGVTYEADIKLLNDQYSIAVEQGVFDREARTAYYNEINALYESGEKSGISILTGGIYSVSYMHMAIGVLIGRALSLPFVWIFMMGKLMNLIVYVMLVYYAIKKIPKGKVLVAAIGMLPTTVFLAASYSYDSWVTGFILLGFTYFFKELQTRETKIETKDFVLMMVFFILGCLPKAVYFIAMLPILFMPKDKFKDGKQRRLYYILAFTSAFILIASFLLPMLIGGAGDGDIRGGSDVNSAEQINFILNNPGEYSGVLVRSIENFLTFKISGDFVMNCFSYLGNGKFSFIAATVIIVLAFIDRGNDYKTGKWVRIAGAFGFALALILIHTALYISFTGVGYPLVAGCQPRYIIPLIFPALYLLGPDNLSDIINKNLKILVPVIMMTFIFLYNINTLIVSVY